MEAWKMTKLLGWFEWLLPVVFLLTGAIARADEQLITIGVNNWAENIAVANMWKLLLDEKGIKVRLQNADKALIYNSVAQGKIDLTFEVWLPAGDKPAFDKVKDSVVQIGPWFKEANLGLVVPDYVAVDRIDQLNANKTLFASSGRPKIVGIDSGSSLMQLTEKAKTTYQLDYDVQSSSESAMVLSLERDPAQGAYSRDALETSLDLVQVQAQVSERPERRLRFDRLDLWNRNPGIQEAASRLRAVAAAMKNGRQLVGKPDVGNHQARCVEPGERCKGLDRCEPSAGSAVDEVSLHSTTTQHHASRLSLRQYQLHSLHPT
jgi:hypothetical protein